MQVLRGSAHAGCPVVGRPGNTTCRMICVPHCASDKSWSLRTSCQQRHPLTFNARGRVADVQAAASSAVTQKVAVSAEISGVRGQSYIVSNSDKQKFKEQGYVHLPGVMSDEELKQDIDDVYEAFLNGSIKVPGKDLCDMSGNQEGRTPDQFTLYNVMLPRVYHPALQGNLYEQRCKDIADQLQGGDMQIDYDQILAKRPQSEDAVFAWHQDMAYWPPFTSDISAATCWLAVSDSTEENGCMRFLPGSHKESELRKHAPVGKTREDSHALYLSLKEDDSVVPVPIQRGDITVHDERVAHGSGPNLSSDWRKAYVVAFRKAECIAEERSLGFTHSHNDEYNWDVFQQHSK